MGRRHAGLREHARLIAGIGKRCADVVSSGVHTPLAAFRRSASVLLALSCFALACSAGCGGSTTNESTPATNESTPATTGGAKSSGGLHATIETDKGPIELEFLPADAPKAVENFRLLAERGYYNGLTFQSRPRRS